MVINLYQVRQFYKNTKCIMRSVKLFFIVALFALCVRVGILLTCGSTCLTSSFYSEVRIWSTQIAYSYWGVCTKPHNCVAMHVCAREIQRSKKKTG